MRLELLQGIVGVVDKGESGGLSSTEVGAETEDGDGGLIGLVKLSELGTEVVLADVCEGNSVSLLLVEDGCCYSIGYVLAFPAWRTSL